MRCASRNSAFCTLHSALSTNSLSLGVKYYAPSQLSLRLGHATALTPPRGVIHYRVAASLPLEGAFKAFLSEEGGFAAGKDGRSQLSAE